MISGHQRQSALTQADHFDLGCVMVDPQHRIRVGYLPSVMREIISEMDHRGVGSLLKNLEIEIHVTGPRGPEQPLLSM